MNILGKIFQLKISLIGGSKNTARVYGNAQASLKFAEVSLALLTLGIRITIRV